MLTINTRTISLFWLLEKQTDTPTTSAHYAQLAKQRQQQAAADLEQAKQQVEKLSLGE